MDLPTQAVDELAVMFTVMLDGTVTTLTTFVVHPNAEAPVTV